MVAAAAVAASAASAAYSAYSANQNSKAQSAAMGAQQNAANANLALQQQYMAQQEARYGPLMDQYVHEASGGGPLDYGLTSGNVQSNFDTAQRNLETQMAARGLSGSGLAGAGATGLEIGRAGALSSAFQQGLLNRRNLGLQVLQHYNPQGAVQGVSGAYGNLQNMYGGYAGMYGQAAQQGYGATANALGSLAKIYQASQAQQQQQAQEAQKAMDEYASNFTVPQMPDSNRDFTPIPTDMPMQPSYLPMAPQATGYDGFNYSGFGPSMLSGAPASLGYGQGTSYNTYGVNP